MREEDITQKHSIGKPIDEELEREMRNINEEHIEKEQENVVSSDNDKTNKENVNKKVSEEDATQRQSTGKQKEKKIEQEMRKINEGHIEKQQEKLSDENDKRSKADSIEKEEQKEKDEKTEENNVTNKELQENRETNNQTRKIIEEEKTNKQKIQNEVIINQNGNEFQNNGKNTAGQKGDYWGEEREEHGGKNTKIKEKEKLLTGNWETQQREEILVEEALMIYNDKRKEVIIKTIKTKKRRAV